MVVGGEGGWGGGSDDNNSMDSAGPTRVKYSTAAAVFACT